MMISGWRTAIRNDRTMTAVRRGLAVVAALGVAACGGSADRAGTEAVAPKYSAEIRRTSFGIPHVLVDDYGGLGYGLAHAYAQDNVCMLAQMITTVNGERSRYFGPDEVAGPDVDSGSISSSNLHSDFFFKYLNAPQFVEAAWAAQKPDIQALLKGYAAGYNRFLADTGAAGLPVECRNVPWVRNITELDLIRHMRRLGAEGSSLYLMAGLVAAEPPSRIAAAGSARSTAEIDVAALQAQLLRKSEAPLGSNGVALGKLATESGRGLLLGNPHYPWYGSMRFYQLHLTIPGQLDVMGASLGGFPLVAIGFNQNIAWTHTVNSSARFTLYALPLDPSDPTRYVVDGATRSMSRQTVTVDVLGADGATTQRSHDFWMSSYGPMLVLPGQLEWGRQVAYALRDANFDNHRMAEVWSAMNRAGSLDQLESAITGIVGIPWVNTLAVDRNGETLYGNVTVVPNVPQAKQDACVDQPYKALAEGGVITVLRASAACDWTVDPAAPQPGIFAGNSLPVLRRADFVQNSNDSAWMTNPAAPLTGFARIVSAQDAPLNERTRIGISQIQARLAGTDGLPGNRFNAEQLAQIAFSNRSYFGTLLREDLLAFCADAGPVTIDGQRVEVQEACAAFRRWDGHANLTSIGYPLARHWIAGLLEHKDIWAVPFSSNDAVNTPRGIKRGDAAVTTKVRAALAHAVLKLREAGIDPAKPWGEIQGIVANGKRIAIPGGPDVYNLTFGIEAGGQAHVRAGSSYIQIVEFRDDGPQVRGLLTYSQSTNPASPHFADQAPRFVALDWIPQPYTQAQIEADPNYRSSTVSE
jgi:acyl-homoserine-lactone acylase